MFAAFVSMLRATGVGDGGCDVHVDIRRMLSVCSNGCVLAPNGGGNIVADDLAVRDVYHVGEPSCEVGWDGYWLSYTHSHDERLGNLSFILALACLVHCFK